MLRLFTWALGIRVLLVLLVSLCTIFNGHILNYAYYGCPSYNTPYLLDDSGYYTLRGLFTAMYWQGAPLNQKTIEDIVTNTYGATGFTSVLALFFMIFGYSPIASRFINCFFGVAIAILIYLIAKEIFGQKTARISAVMTAFFPSLILWSITNLKEPSFIFGIYLMILGVIMLRSTKKISWVAIILFSLWFQDFIRRGYNKEMLFINIFITLLYFATIFILHLIKRRHILILGLVLLTCSTFLLPQQKMLRVKLAEARYKIFVQHAGAITTGGECYKLLAPQAYKGETINNAQLLQMFFWGWLHLIFEPFIWNIKSLHMLYVAPQVLFWYFLVVFGILGIAISLRYKLKESVLLFLYLAGMGSVIAATGGNIGSIFRFRDVLSPIVIIYAAVGICNLFGWLEWERAERI